MVAGCGPDSSVVAEDGGGSEDSSGATPADGTTFDPSDGVADSSSSGVEPEPVDPFAGAELVVLEPLDGNLGFGDFDGDGDDDIVTSYEQDVPLIPDLVRLAVYGLDREKGEVFGIRYQDVGFVMQPYPGHVDANASLDVVAVGGSGLVQFGTVGDAFEQGPTVEIDGELVGPVMDFDGDGRVEYLEREGDLRIHGADGSGGWALETTIAFDADCASTTASWADLDGDGDLDFVTSGACDDGERVTTFLQGEDGAFESGAASTLPFAISRVTLADVDGDGGLDLFASSLEDGFENPPLVVATVRRGDGDGGFGDSLVELSAEAYGIGAFAADFDGDGIAELYLDTYGVFPESTARSVLVRLIDGELVAHDVPFGVAPLYAADLDGNGCEDMVGVRDSQDVVLLSGCQR